MKKILFINAVNSYSEVENRYPPLWPAYLAAYTEHKIGKDSFDFRFLKGSLLPELESFQPDLVALSAVTQNFNYAVKYAETAKAYNLPVIIGGIHITSLPTTLTPEMDVGCIGEGEETFVELLTHFLKYNGFNPSFLGEINGIVFRENNRLIKTKDREPIPSLSLIPPPKRSLIGYGSRSYIYSARGCSYQCVFCICTRYWGKIRYSTAEAVVDEIGELIHNGIRRIRIADENFSGNLQRLKKIAELLRSRGYHKKAKFSCWCRSNTVSLEVVELLKSMNIVSVKIGLESGAQRTLDYLKGHVTVEDNIRAILLFKLAGIQVNADFIIGAPDETPAEMLETLDFIGKMPLDFVDVNIFTAYPGTPVWDLALKKKLVSETMNWELINIKLDKSEQNHIILSDRVTYPELYRIYKKFKKAVRVKTVKALLHTPWKTEIPKIIFKRIIEKVKKFKDIK